ncbi:hypothetical protein LR48_Vigan08g122300 [Vigna angularis]|uniref:RFTS domain-containing protein n=1 Tax=Phaseolus angularis TaxID=3914 RepID=A0A0L9V5S5_PHAAN|nr:hypothetical protein LR48_Vigan08g122300 [Vigna angularis]
MARSMSGSRSFSGTASIKDFVISQSYEAKKQANHAHMQVMPSNGSLRIDSGTGDEENKNQMDFVDSPNDEDEDAKLARLLQEEEYWKSMKQKKNNRSASVSNKFYIKINEDEIANDYPLPAFYTTSLQETDEFIVFDNDYDVYDTEDLPGSMFHKWSLYNSDARLVSLELVLMKACSDNDVAIFGSGVMTSDEGSEFHLETEAGQSSSTSSEAQAADGMPISPFVTGLTNKMEERHRTKWFVKKKKVLARSEPNLNPRAAVGAVVSKRKSNNNKANQ